MLAFYSFPTFFIYFFFYHNYKLLTQLAKYNCFNEICIFLTVVVSFSARDIVWKEVKMIFPVYIRT